MGNDKTPSTDTNKTSVSLEIEWEIDQNFLFPLASHMLINSDGDHFYLRFYQTTPPVRETGEPPPKTVFANFVSGIAVPVSQMRGFIRAMQSTLEAHESVERRPVDSQEGE